MAARVLIDTSAWIEALRSNGDEVVRHHVSRAVENGAAVFCDLVLLELWNGARGKRERDYLSSLEKNLHCLETTPEVWRHGRRLARRCRRKGLTVPATDLLIQACAAVHGVPLLHRDRHFEAVAGLET